MRFVSRIPRRLSMACWTPMDDPEHAIRQFPAARYGRTQALWAFFDLPARFAA